MSCQKSATSPERLTYVSIAQGSTRQSAARYISSRSWAGSISIPCSFWNRAPTAPKLSQARAALGHLLKRDGLRALFSRLEAAHEAADARSDDEHLAFLSGGDLRVGDISILERDRPARSGHAALRIGSRTTRRRQAPSSTGWRLRRRTVAPSSANAASAQGNMSAPGSCDAVAPAPLRKSRLESLILSILSSFMMPCSLDTPSSKACHMATVDPTT